MKQQFTNLLRAVVMVSVWVVGIGASLMTGSAWAQTPPITTALTSTTTSTFFFNSTSGRRNQMILLPADVNGEFSGNVTSIWFRRSTANTGVVNYPNFSVKLAVTSQTTHSGTNFITTGFTTVRSASNFALPIGAIDDWFEVPLTTPFAWNPSSGNLVIEIEHAMVTSGGPSLRCIGTNTRRLYHTGSTAHPSYIASATGTSSSFPLIGLTMAAAAGTDAAASGIAYSPTLTSVNCTGGNVAVTASVANFGGTNITSMGIEWFVNNVSQGIVNLTGLNIASTASANLSLGNYNVTGPLPRVLQFRYEILTVNGSADGVSTNNVFQDVTNRSGLSGTFTVGAGEVYTSPAQLADSLRARGLCGPVVANIKAGTYTGQVNIANVVGANSTNTITLQPQTPGTVTLAFDANTTADPNYLINIFNTDNVTIKGLTLNRNTAAGTPTHSRIIDVSGGSDNVTIEGNTFNGFMYASGATTNITASIYSNTSVDNNLTVKDNVFSGNGIAVSVNAVAGSTETGLIQGNTMSNFSYGIFVGNLNGGFTIRDNEITRYDPSSTGTYYGIYLQTLADLTAPVFNNKVAFSTGGSGYGLFITGVVGNATTPATIYNNFFSATAGASGVGGAIHIVGGSANLNFYYNNTRAATGSTTVTNCYGLRVDATGTGTNLNFSNNNFVVNHSSGFAYYTATLANLDRLGTVDNNNYFVSHGGAVARIVSTDLADVSELDAHSSGKFSNSYGIDPLYTSATDLHISAVGLATVGLTVPGITTDIDGQNRKASPSIGADEIFPVVNNINLTAVGAGVTTFCSSGSTSPTFTILNAGTNTINNVTISWSLVTNTVVGAPTVQTFSGLGLLPGSSATVTASGSWSYSGANYYQIQATATLVNGVADPNTADNSRSSITVSSGVPTSITVNASLPNSTVNYQNFSRLIDTLGSKGVCGPTVVQFVQGVYGGPFTLGAIPGTSSVNTITFKGISSNRNLVVLTNASSASTTNNFTLRLSGSEFLIFQDLTIRRTDDGSNHANGNTVLLDGLYHDLLFDNCALTSYSSNATTGQANHAVMSTTTGAAPRFNVTVQNSLLSGGRANVWWLSTSTQRDNNINFLNNIFKMNNAGLRFSSTGYVTVNDNIIEDDLSEAFNADAIYITGSNAGGSIQRNRIKLVDGGTLDGIYFTSGDGTAVSPWTVTNNYVALLGAGNHYCVYHTTNGNYIQLRHNTLVTNGSGTAYGLYSISSAGTNLTVANNILASLNPASGTGHGLYIVTNGLNTSDALNNNVIYTANTARFAFLGSARNTLADYLTAGGTKVAGTVDLNPNFFTEDSYVYTNSGINGIGANLGITTDIEGNTRGTTPDPGCYESEPTPNDGGLIGLYSTHDCASNGQEVKVTLGNTGTNNITSATINWQINGLAQTQASVSGLNLAPGDQAVVTLGTANFAAGQTYTVDATVVNINGVVDTKPFNNVMAQGSVTVGTPNAGALPTTVDFETQALASGVPAGWVISPAPDGTTYRWTVGEGANGLTTTGPNTDRNGSATGNYLYVVANATGAASGNVATFTTGCFNTNGIQTPAIKFWYHRYGASMPVFHLDYYRDGTWQESVFTMTGQDPDQTAATSAWKQVQVLLPTSVSNQVRFRFRVVRNTTTTGEMAIDDIQIYDASGLDLRAESVGFTSIVGCPTANETATVVLRNLSSTTHDFSVRPIRVTLGISGAYANTIQQVVNTGTLAPNATLSVNFTGISLLPTGTYNLTATHNLIGIGELDPTNNSVSLNGAYSRAAVTSNPFFTNLTGFTGANLGTIVPGAYEATGTARPTTVGTANWINRTTGPGSLLSLSMNLFTTTRNDWAVLPPLQPLANTKMRFRLAMTDFNTANVDAQGGMVGTDDFMAVRITTDCGVSWQNILLIDPAWVTANGLTNVYQDVAIDLSAYAGQYIQLAFYAQDGPVDNANDYNMHVRDVLISNDDYLTWNGSVSNSVTNASNWTPAMVPSPAYGVRFTNAGTAPLVSGNIDLTNVHLNTGANFSFTGTPTFRVSGNITRTPGAIPTFPGPFNLEMTGSSNKTIAGIGLNVHNLQNFTNSGTGRVTIQNDMVVNNAVSLGNGILDLNNNRFTLRSTGMSTGGYLAPVTGSGSVENAANFTVQSRLAPAQSVSAPALTGGWYFMSTNGIKNKSVNAWTLYQPYAPGTYDGNIATASQLYKYSPTNTSSVAGWVEPASPSTSLLAGEGMRFYYQHTFFNNRNGIHAVSGEPHIGDYNFSSQLQYCATGCAWQDPNGWNLVANPYASAIDWDDADWTKDAALANEIKIWNPVAGQYASYAGGIGQNGGTNKIAAGQAFFVRLTGTPSGPNALVAREGVKTTGASMLRVASPAHVLRIGMVDDANNRDEAVVRLLAGATLGYDPAYDASFMPGNVMNVYSHFGGRKLSINAVDMPTASTTVPLGIVTSRVGNHVFNFTGLTDILALYDVYLVDAHTGARTALTEGASYAYAVTADPLTQGDSRFSIVFQASVTSLKGGVAAAQVVAYPNPSSTGNCTLQLNNLPEGAATITIVDAAGKALATEVVTINNVLQTVSLNKIMAAGMYTISVRSAAGVQTIKWVVQQ